MSYAPAANMGIWDVMDPNVAIALDISTTAVASNPFITAASTCAGRKRTLDELDTSGAAGPNGLLGSLPNRLYRPRRRPRAQRLPRAVA